MAGEPATDGLDELARRLAPVSIDRELLRLALTHRSYCAEHPGTQPNERLEFLGDAVLGLVVTNELYQRFPELPEGDLARIRADVVSSAALAPIARAIGIGPALYLGRGEENSGGRRKPSILADALEAVMGAAYLSSGIEQASGLVLELTTDTISEVSRRSVYGDPKNRLQELAQKVGEPTPSYRLTEVGPDHRKRFVAQVDFLEHSGRGEGNSKKAAERNAALAVLGALGEEDA